MSRHRLSQDAGAPRRKNLALSFARLVRQPRTAGAGTVSPFRRNLCSDSYTIPPPGRARGRCNRWFYLGLPGQKHRATKGRLENARLKLVKLSLEPPGSAPLVESYLGRMRRPDQAAYLRFIHTLGIDSRWLKNAVRQPAEQSIGFIAFSRLHVFLRLSGRLGYKISGLDRISVESGLFIRPRIRHL